MIAWSRVITGSALRPTFLLMAVAHPITPSRPTRKISTDSLAFGSIARSWCSSRTRVATALGV
jgi:hypothetical protein